MKTKFQKTAVSLGVLMFLALSVPGLMPAASANHGYCHGGGRGMKGNFEGMFFFKSHFLLENAEQLALTEKQQEEIQNLKLEVKKSLIKQEAEVEVVELDIAQRVHGKVIDTEAVNKLIDQKFELKKTELKFIVESMAKLKQILSDEQYAKMKELFSQGKGVWKKG